MHAFLYPSFNNAEFYAYTRYYTLLRVRPYKQFDNHKTPRGHHADQAVFGLWSIQWPIGVSYPGHCLFYYPTSTLIVMLLYCIIGTINIYKKGVLQHEFSQPPMLPSRNIWWAGTKYNLHLGNLELPVSNDHFNIIMFYLNNFKFTGNLVELPSDTTIFAKYSEG